MYRIQKKKIDVQKNLLIENGKEEDVTALTGWREPSKDPLGSDSDEIEQDVTTNGKKFVKTPKPPVKESKDNKSKVEDAYENKKQNDSKMTFTNKNND